MNILSKNMVQSFVISYATKSQIALIGSILGFGLIGINPAQAASLNNSTGILNPATTITFSEVPLADGTRLTNQYSSLGVTFTDLFYNTSTLGIPNINSPAASNFNTSAIIISNPFLISFTQLQSQAAFSIGTNPGLSNFEALLNNIVIDSFTGATDTTNPNNFYGFTGVTFDAIRITAGGLNRISLIDNIQFNPVSTPTAVPEPFTIIGTIIGGTVAIRIRKKLKVD